MGLSPLHFITQRGPLQDGESVIDMRFDPRTIQIVIAETLMDRTSFWDRKWDWFDLLRPNRSFDGTVKPLIYRKWLPHGKVERGTDLVADGVTGTVTSHMGRFVERGLEAGQTLYIAGTAYTVVSVPNDYTAIVDITVATPAAGTHHWRYSRGRGVRDLYCLLAQGPAFDQGPGPMPSYPTGYREALRFIAHDPFWYGTEQSQTWEIGGALGDLVFDLGATGPFITTTPATAGGWLGVSHGSGRWLFAPTFVGESVQVIYWGTAPAKPVITITGPAENPAIENTTIGTRIEMDYTVALGEMVTVDTLALTVQNHLGTNLLPYTSGDLATFQLSPTPQAPNRNNEIYVSFSSATTDSEAEMTWRNRHVGLA